MVKRQALNVSLALACGSLGGLVFSFLNLPLPWLLGALCATIVGSMAGLPIEIKSGLRKYFIIVLGVMLGGTFSPEILTRAGDWIPTLAAAIVYLALVTLVAQLYCRKVLKMDPITALFAGTPGGLSEMIILGEEMHANVQVLTLTHIVRVATVLLAIPFFLTYWSGLDGRVMPTPSNIWTAQDVGILAACAVLGYFGGKLCRLPVPALTGPMLLSAGVHLSGLIAGSQPLEVSLAMQVAMGSALGARFFGVSVATVGRLLVLAFGMALIMMTVTLVAAAVLSAITGASFEALVLALSPGGFAEMALVALSMNIDPAFVTTHHGLRLTLVVFLVPAVVSYQKRRAKQAAKTEQ